MSAKRVDHVDAQDAPPAARIAADDRVENVGVRVTPQRPFNEERPSS